MNLHEIAVRCSRIAAAHGFDVPTWDTFPVKVMLVVTEIVEAAEARDNKLALSEEFADVAIRTLDILETLWGAEWSASRVESRRTSTVSRYADMEVLLWPTLVHCAYAIEDWRLHEVHAVAGPNKTNAKIRLEMALLELWRLADALEIDLEAAIAAKSAKNEAREPRHGKARSEG